MPACRACHGRGVPAAVLGVRECAHTASPQGLRRARAAGCGAEPAAVSPQLCDVGPVAAGGTGRHSYTLPTLPESPDAPQRAALPLGRAQEPWVGRLGAGPTRGWARPPPGALLLPAPASAGGGRGTGPQAPPGVGWGSVGRVAIVRHSPVRGALPPAAPLWVPSSEADLGAGECQHCRHATWHLAPCESPAAEMPLLLITPLGGAPPTAL